MKTIVSNNIRIENYPKELLQYCENTLILDNPEYLSAVKNNRYLGAIDKKIQLFKRSGDALILPFGCSSDIMSLLKTGEIETNLISTSTNSMQGSIPLYSYQKDAVDGIAKVRNGILKAPCGSGKTQMGFALIEKLGKKCLWLTHTSDLLKQSKKRAEMYYTGDFGTITGGKVDIGKDITFATVQTMCKLDLSQLANEFEMIIVDECHRCAGTPTKMTQFYKVVDNLKTRYKFGLTATTHRADDMMQCVYSLLGNVGYEVDEKHVTSTLKAQIERIDTNIPRSLDYAGTDGKMIYSELIRYLTEHEGRNELICSLISEDRNTLILSNLVSHCKLLHELIPNSYLAVGSTSAKKRDEAFEEIKNSKEKGKVLIATYSLAKEGLDIPNLDTLILATPQKDFAIVKQSVGRVERKAQNKDDAIVYDIVDKEISYCLGAYNKRRKIYNS